MSRILASQHDAGTAYAAFDHHKASDFAPYLLKTTDAGRTWTAIQGDLPANGPVLAIAEDHVNPQLLFAGTEFGLFFTIDGGKKWVQLKGGMPTVAVRDLAIQKRMNDLVVGTFGRGIYVLDDYTPLRELKPDTLEQNVVLFPIENALMYIETRQYGLRGKGFQGESFFTAENPPYGAQFTYYLKDEIKTRKQQRRDAEKEAEKKKAAAALSRAGGVAGGGRGGRARIAADDGGCFRARDPHADRPDVEGYPSGELESARACGAAAGPASR